MNFQITPAATMLIASGTKMTRLGDRLVADPIDQHRDDQAAADREQRSAGQPDDVVTQGDERVFAAEEPQVVLEADERRSPAWSWKLRMTVPIVG